VAIGVEKVVENRGRIGSLKADHCQFWIGRFQHTIEVLENGGELFAQLFFCLGKAITTGIANDDFIAIRRTRKRIEIRSEMSASLSSDESDGDFFVRHDL
jgi:hypothetical protein